MKKLGGCTGKGFMPGVSGNPSGRTRRNRDVRELLEEFGSAKFNPKVDKTRDEHFWELVYQGACRGNPHDRKLWAAYRHGNPSQSIDLTVLTPEQEVDQLEQLLAALPATEDDKPSGDTRVN